jgi:hypothetical protein
MITSLILYAQYGALWAITAPIRALPTATLPEGVTNAITTLGGYIQTINTVLPVTFAAIIAIIVFVTTLEGGIFAYKGIMWVVRKIPGVS